MELKTHFGVLEYPFYCYLQLLKIFFEHNKNIYPKHLK